MAIKPPRDLVTLQIAGQNFAGWQDVQIVRGVELFPSYFSLKLTERLPGAPKSLAIDPGQTCRVMIGSDLVLTGYVDSYESRISARGHEITVIGRSGTQDLVDCAAGITPAGDPVQPAMTFSAPTLLKLAQDLCAPFGIKVTEPDGEGVPLVSFGNGGIPAFTMPLGATVYDYLEPKARIRQMLMLDGRDGNLILAKVGTKKASSGFTLPGNVLEAQVRFSKQDRFTIYLPVAHPFDNFRELVGPDGRSANSYAPVPDAAAFKNQPRLDGKPRYRPHFVISDQPFPGSSLAEQLAKWEKARRYGRSQAVTALVPLWRDISGALWTPNTLAQVDMPALKVPACTWLISQVTFLKGDAGTRTAVTLMPPEAFQPDPTFDTSFNPQITQAFEQSRANQKGSI